MSDAKEVILNLKQSRFPDAMTRSVLIPNVDGNYFLVPIGPWILHNSELILQMCDWREISKRNFFAIFPKSVDSMTAYLESKSITRDDVVLFSIYSLEEGFQGHIGLSNVSEYCAEIDGVMLSPSLRGRGLASQSLTTLMDWAYIHLKTRLLTLNVLSSNDSAIKLYSNLGFQVQEVVSLKEVITGNMIELIDAEVGEGTSGLSRIKMFRFDDQGDADHNVGQK